ncbi:uncharacterized protein B0I36DRAFT_359335 [Microdochium trichocladiopsis]|uniref:Aminoglycoside phosphotransferase domain-containing protein n=1 Tax=Microdochium trichocladiopsis TaxID=1682393 RepID=A0A9P8YGS9_9PEZI|nr:uncharacterized protein B0I36DRAFT_359335 [Microdochium trichocladiopsis]KAH7037673.1 hypothetical protein B0I36DRAFT_359335 [Microdochium trichocladiopsis]
MDARPRADSAICLPAAAAAAAAAAAEGFFARQGLPVSAREQCDDDTPAARTSIQDSNEPGRHLTEARDADHDADHGDGGMVIQFRPRAHAIDTEVAAVACSVYGRLAPRTQKIGELGELELVVYALHRIIGVSLLDSRITAGAPPPPSSTGVSSLAPPQRDAQLLVDQPQGSAQRERLVRDFARFHATGFKDAIATSTTTSETTKSTTKAPPRRGLVGASLRSRLQTMHASLPQRLKPFVVSALDSLEAIESALPWVLTHGDLLPANIMVDPATGALAGLIDWAEAEHLPFGVGMYGLEELLGEQQVQGQEQQQEQAIEDQQQGDGTRCGGDAATKMKKEEKKTKTETRRFIYCPDARRLRRMFWDELTLLCPELVADETQEGQKQMPLLPLVKKAQDLGVLLWHGIAFDDGALDRGCAEGRDDEEIAKLDAFFFFIPPSSSLPSPSIAEPPSASPTSPSLTSSPSSSPSAAVLAGRRRAGAEEQGAAAVPFPSNATRYPDAHGALRRLLGRSLRLWRSMRFTSPAGGGS